MTFTLTVAFWWIVPIAWTAFAYYMAVDSYEYKTSFIIWLLIMAVIFLARFLP